MVSSKVIQFGVILFALMQVALWCEPVRNAIVRRA